MAIAIPRKSALQWSHNGPDSVSNHQPHDCLLNRLFGRRSKKTPKLRITGLCAGNSPGTGEFLAQMANYAENVDVANSAALNKQSDVPVNPIKLNFELNASAI